LNHFHTATPSTIDFFFLIFVLLRELLPDAVVVVIELDVLFNGSAQLGFEGIVLHFLLKLKTVNNRGVYYFLVLQLVTVVLHDLKHH
jgi:hypothetical protein